MISSGNFYIFSTILCTVYGQIILKWRVMQHGNMPERFSEGFAFLLKLLVDPFVISAFVAAFIAALCWMAALTKFDLSYAYPFMSIPFVIVLFLSGLFFHEIVTLPKIIGMLFIVTGLIIGARS